VTWYCKIREVLGDPCVEKPAEEPVEVKKEIVEDVLIYQLPSPYCNDPWDYKMHGDNWQCKCAEGMK